MARLFGAVTRAVFLLLCLPLGALALEYPADLGNHSKIEAPQPIERVAQPVISMARIRDLIAGLSVVEVEPRTLSRSLDFDRSRDVTLSSVFSVWTLPRQVVCRLEAFCQRMHPHTDFDASRFRMYRDAAHSWARPSGFSHRMQGIPPSPAPQPTAAVLMGIGLTGLVVAGRRYDP